jgi:L-aspartate oxidase
MRFLPDDLSRKEELKRIMWEKAGIIRSGAFLEEASSLLERWTPWESAPVLTREELEFRNLLTVSRLVVQGALLRKESIGVHYREDFPESRESAVHYPLKKGAN